MAGKSVSVHYFTHATVIGYPLYGNGHRMRWTLSGNVSQPLKWNAENAFWQYIPFSLRVNSKALFSPLFFQCEKTAFLEQVKKILGEGLSSWHQSAIWELLGPKLSPSAFQVSLSRDNFHKICFCVSLSGIPLLLPPHRCQLPLCVSNILQEPNVVSCLANNVSNSKGFDAASRK